MLAPQLGLAASEPVRRCGSVRSAKGRVLRRRLFRRVTVVDFAAAIAAAEERGESSHGDMDTPQTITEKIAVRVFCRVCRHMDSGQAKQGNTKGRTTRVSMQAGGWTWNPALELLGEPAGPPWRVWRAMG